VRAADLDDLEELKARVLAALEAGATAAGCTVDHEWHDPAYADLVTDEWLITSYAANSHAVGRPLDQVEASVMGSTDMGNVSHEVPAIHPMIAVAPPGVSIHTPEFADHAVAPEGDAAVIDGAKAMACTVIDVWAAGASAN